MAFNTMETYYDTLRVAGVKRGKPLVIIAFLM